MIFIYILLKADNFTDATTIDIDSLIGAGSYLDTGDRSNVLEVNIERAENFDADELRRDAYEEGWNKLQ